MLTLNKNSLIFVSQLSLHSQHQIPKQLWSQGRQHVKNTPPPVISNPSCMAMRALHYRAATVNLTGEKFLAFSLTLHALATRNHSFFHTELSDQGAPRCPYAFAHAVHPAGDPALPFSA